MSFIDFDAILTVVSGLAGAITARAILSERRADRVAHRALEAVEQQDKTRAVEAMDLASVGDYLFGTLGAMSIRDYAEDKEARRFVARAVDRVDALLGGTGVNAVEPTEEHLEAARTAFTAGDSWTALARLRLAIELRLRDIALSYGLPAERTSAGRTLQLLLRNALIDKHAAQDLLRAIRVANSVVHGYTVDADEAEAAIGAATRGLERLSAEPRRPGPHPRRETR